MTDNTQDKQGPDLLDDFIRRRVFSATVGKDSQPAGNAALMSLMNAINECDEPGTGSYGKDVMADKFVKVLKDDELDVCLRIAADTAADAEDKPTSAQRKTINAGREISTAMQNGATLSVRMSRADNPMQPETAVNIMNAAAGVYGPERADGMRMGQAALLMSSMNTDSPLLAEAASGAEPWSAEDREMSELRMQGRLMPVTDRGVSWVAVIHDENGKAALMGFQGKVVRPPDFRDGQYDVSPEDMVARASAVTAAPHI